MPLRRKRIRYASIPTSDPETTTPKQTVKFAAAVVTESVPEVLSNLPPYLPHTMDGPADSKTHLTWGNVGIGFAFIAFDAIISRFFGLGVGLPLVTAAVRCIVQLAIMALVLQKIFEAENPWGVAGLAGELTSPFSLWKTKV